MELIIDHRVCAVVTNENLSLFKISTGCKWGIWLLWWWEKDWFSCPHEFCCINDLWRMFCKGVIDNKSLTRLKGAKPLIFWDHTNAKLIMGITGRRGSLEQWIGDEGVMLG